MPENQFSSATGDPIALLEQLLGHVAGIRRDMSQIQQDVSELKQDVAELKQDVAVLKQDVAELKGCVENLERRMDGLEAGTGGLRSEVTAMRADVAAVRGELTRFVSTVDQDQTALRTQVENAIERKTWLAAQRLREEWQARYADLERRLTELEAERRGRESMGAQGAC